MEKTSGWFQRVLGDPKRRQVFEEEKLILSVAEGIWEAMDQCCVTRADIADRLGTTRANITQLLSGSRNMTLKSLAALSHACGVRVSFSFQPVPELAGATSAYESRQAPISKFAFSWDEETIALPTVPQPPAALSSAAAQGGADRPYLLVA